MREGAHSLLKTCKAAGKESLLNSRGSDPCALAEFCLKAYAPVSDGVALHILVQATIETSSEFLKFLSSNGDDDSYYQVLIALENAIVLCRTGLHTADRAAVWEAVHQARLRNPQAESLGYPDWENNDEYGPALP